MASSCRRNVNFARKCSLTHLQAQRKFTSAGCHLSGWYCNSIQYLRTVCTYSTFVQYVSTVRTRTVLHCTSTGTSTVYTMGTYTQYMYMYSVYWYSVHVCTVPDVNARLSSCWCNVKRRREVAGAIYVQCHICPKMTVVRTSTMLQLYSY